MWSNIRTALPALLLLALVGSSAGARRLSAGHVPDTVVDVVSNNDDFDVLYTAVDEAGLADTLSGEGPFTVFAPTDQAFQELLSTLNVTAEELLAMPGLDAILLYHVVPGKVAPVLSSVTAVHALCLVRFLHGLEVVSQ
eukprot:scaffold176565_cov23-Prasinocladus_malaysianus.AAC.1